MSSRSLRKLQNDEELLESILKKSKEKSGNVDKKMIPKVNMFALMSGDDDDDDESDENEHCSDLSSEIRPVKVQLASKKKKKGKKVTRSEDEVELDEIIQQFRRKDLQKYGVRDEDEFYECEDEEMATCVKMGDLMGDSGFTKCPKKGLHRFFNADFKKLDPHYEFKLLFGDLSTKSLEDIDSMTTSHVSPQQLKQLQRMKRLMKNWGGKDHRTVPNGPGSSVHRLQFTKVREDWLPTPRPELVMKQLTLDELRVWKMWQRPRDWKDVIEEDIQEMTKSITFYKFEPLNPDMNRKAMTEFYLSTILHPDHEALIHLISSKYPYHVPALLQVALILIRQGDRSNTNGLLQRALFVFDRALKPGIQFNSQSCQLPYIYFYNRQFYFAIFRYVLALAQRGAVATASEWCKVLWSLSPLEDPLGCRYFIDHYLLLNNDYQYLIDLSKSALVTSYKQWCTLGLTLSAVLSYLRVGLPEEARKALRDSFKLHINSYSMIFIEKLSGHSHLTSGTELKITPSGLIETKAYLARFATVWSKPEEITFLHDEMASLYKIIREGNADFMQDPIADCPDDGQNPLFIKGIPVNLLRFAILSEEPSVMGSLPSHIWEDNEVYEFDVLPPTPTSKESIEVLETVKDFIQDKELITHEMERMQDDEILNQVRQMSLEQFLEENPNAGIE
ncbi:hypothetical protein HG537_0E02610 [Torulaspora globosa]|uniref:DUF654-domain-containing protein n=1 Tax=Torulaspora globosa TaxID=48254 RepID=A0A7H9HV86_9SACH|nr:hypothetical protein HG537_0E02610 [Torulaspora sp. CBS 2947]